MHGGGGGPDVFTTAPLGYVVDSYFNTHFISFDLIMLKMRCLPLLLTLLVACL